jgi:hypothetical protein
MGLLRGWATSASPVENRCNAEAPPQRGFLPGRGDGPGSASMRVDEPPLTSSSPG